MDHDFSHDLAHHLHEARRRRVRAATTQPDEVDQTPIETPVNNEIPEVPKSDPLENETVVDSGASEILQSMLGSMGDPLQGEDGITRIGLYSMRNQSRGDRDTFETMRDVLMDSLTRAGQSGRIFFTDAQEVALQYRLEGTAYLLGNNHTPRWELYLQLHREEDGKLVWEPEGVIRIYPTNNVESGEPILQLNR